MPGFDSNVTFDATVVLDNSLDFTGAESGTIIPDIFVTHATDRSVRILFAALDCPVVSAPTTRGQMSWAELEVPGSTARIGEVSWTEFQTPGNWIAPIGVPTPSFGIDNVTPTFNGGNSLHYYIDNTDPNATDTSNPNGTPGVPRLTLPTPWVWAAGTYIEVHGGPYTLPGASPTFKGNGTAPSPVFLTGKGTTRPKLVHTSDSKFFDGSYFIVEYLDFDRIDTKGTGSFIGVRDCDIHHHPGRNGATVSGTQIVIYLNHIHHVGNQVTPDDRHGVTCSAVSTDVWIVDNELDHCSGDGVQFAHGALPPGPQRVYVGRNVIHDNAENAVDFKTCRGVVVSQNNMYGHRPGIGSDGTAVLIGSNGLADPAVNVWVVFNNIHDNELGVRIEAAAGTDGAAGPAYIVGNLIRNCAKSAVKFDKAGIPIYIVNNTIHSCDTVVTADWREFFDAEIWNNIVHTVTGQQFGKHVYIEFQVVAARSAMSNNCFYRGGASLAIAWGAEIETYVDTADMTTRFGGGANNKIEDPLFVNLSGNDFHLQAGSPAVGAAADHAVYDIFETQFPGQSIKFDFDGVARPQGASWDMGCYERV